VLLLGPSGSGKSTLLLTLTGLIPRSIPADMEGWIRLLGADPLSAEPWAWSRRVAQYFQDADQTLCGMRVEDEIAFALENHAVAPAEIERSVTVAMREGGLPDDWRDRRCTTLSGGERQLVALAATLVQNAELLVVDEPTAHLAPQAAERLYEVLLRAHDTRTVLIVDHRLDGMLDAIDRVIVLGRDGRVQIEGPPRGLFRDHLELLNSLGIWAPAAAHLDDALRQAGLQSPQPPLSVTETLQHLDPSTAPPEFVARAIPVVQRYVERNTAPSTEHEPHRRPVVQLTDATVAAFLGPVVLRGINLFIRQGEVLGILGANGAGKSTLGAALSGVLALKAGSRTGPPGGIAFQKPETQFTAPSVADELRSALPDGMEEKEKQRRICAALDRWRLSGLERQHPFELSQGQQRRLALAALLINERWPLLILDEPFAGLDAAAADVLAEEILALRHVGLGIALITHDMDMALRLCERSVILGLGEVLAEGETRALLEDEALLQRAGLSRPVISPALDWLRRASC
jgi:energy-coupling factor transport system ATP-binding protein